MNNKHFERNALFIGIFINLVMAIVGWYTYNLTNMQALLLDGNFSFIASMSCLVAIVITKYSTKKSLTFPRGHFLLEPLYAVMKQLLILAILAISITKSVTKINDFVTNGNVQVLNLTPVMVYSVAMALLCFSLSFIYSRFNKKMGSISIILTSESKSSYIDGIMSAGIGIAAMLLSFIPSDSSLSFMAYIGDSVITLILVIITIRTPFKVLYKAFKELTNGVVTDEKIRKPIVDIITRILPNHIILRDCRIRKTGTAFHINLNLSFTLQIVDVSELKSIKEKIEIELMKNYNHVSVNCILH